MALYLRIARDPPARLGPELAPEAVATALTAALAKDPAERPASAAAFAASLQSAQRALGLTPDEPVVHEPDPNRGEISDWDEAIGPDVDTRPAPGSIGDVTMAPSAVTAERATDIGGARRAGRPNRLALTGIAAAIALLAAGSVFALSRGPAGQARSPGELAGQSTTMLSAGPGNATSPTAGPGEPRCAVFPTDDPWNTEVAALPVHARSGEWMAALTGSLADAGEDRLRPGFGRDDGFVYTIVGAGQPTQPLVFGTDSAIDTSDTGPFPIPLDAPTWNGTAIVVDDDACRLYEVLGEEDDPGPGARRSPL